MGFLSGVVSIASAPVRLTLRAWEVGLSTAAEAARIAQELLAPDEPGPDYARRTPPTQSEPGGNGRPPPEPYVRADVTPVAPDAPPAVPDQLVPDHLDEEPVLVAEAAEEGAEEGAGPELRVEAPWDGYDRMTAADIRARLAAATPAEAAAVELYEATRKGRSSVLEAAQRALRR